MKKERIEVRKWDVATNILFAGKDTFQTLEIVKDFADKYQCALTVSGQSEHPFTEEGDGDIVEKWLWDNV